MNRVKGSAGAIRSIGCPCPRELVEAPSEGASYGAEPVQDGAPPPRLSIDSRIARFAELDLEETRPLATSVGPQE